jgi:hypothetical protein
LVIGAGQDPLHQENQDNTSTSLLSSLFPNSRGVAPRRAPIDLHALWDGIITSRNNIGRLRKVATELAVI